MYDFVTIGGATRDVFFEVSEGRVIADPEDSMSSRLLGFEYGSKIIPENAYFSYGGGAVNTAVSLSKMGFSVAGCFRIGQEGTGDILLKDLENHGVDRQYAEKDPELHTSLSFVIDVPDADRLVFLYPGASANLTIDNLDDIQAHWFYLNSLIGQAATLLPKIAGKVETDNIKLVFNPGETQLHTGYSALRGIIKCSYILIINRQEAAQLVLSDNPRAPTSKIQDLLAAMRNWCSKYIVITDGRDGSYVYDRDKTLFLPAYPASSVDMTGAGDAFGSSFASGLVHFEGNVEKAMKLAAANAASVVGQRGAHTGALSLKEAEAIMARNANIEVKYL